MTSTPYEIRLDVLKLAQQLVNEDNQTKKEKLLQELNSSQKTQDEINSILSKFDSISYSETDVIKRANSLYSFVSTNSSTSRVK